MTFVPDNHEPYNGDDLLAIIDHIDAEYDTLDPKLLEFYHHFIGNTPHQGFWII
jgi:hypothetical protein